MFVTLISTSPAGLGATGMLFAFSIFYIFFFTFFLLLLHILQIIFIRAQPKASGDEFQYTYKNLPIGRQYSISITLAFAPVILIALRSIGQLDLTSAVLVTVFELVAIFYILKR